jgi:hypothetical protein
MPSTTKLSGNVALPQLSVSTDGGSTYTDIANLVSPPFASSTTDLYDATDTDVTDNFKKYLSGWEDGTEDEFELIYTETSYVALKALPKTELDWKLTWTDPEDDLTDPELDWKGIITQQPTISGPIDDTWKINATIKATSEPAFTAGTATP